MKLGLCPSLLRTAALVFQVYRKENERLKPLLPMLVGQEVKTGSAVLRSSSLHTASVGRPHYHLTFYPLICPDSSAYLFGS